MKNLSKVAIIIFIITLLSKILGFLREMVLAYTFGTSYIVDAYTVAITLPSVVFSACISGFSQSFIPVSSRIRDEGIQKRFYNNLQTILAIISILISLICFVFSDFIVEMLAPGFSDEAIALTNQFVKIIALIFPAMSLFNIAAANLSFHERFTFLYICDYIFLNIIIIVSIFIASKTDISFLAWGYLLSQVIVLVLLWIYSEKAKIQNYQFCVDCKDPLLKEILFLAIPLGISLFANQINAVVDRLLASSIGEGVISALSYANKVQLLIMGLTISIFSAVCYPRLNKFFARKEYEKGFIYINYGIMFANFIAIPLTIFLFFYAAPVVMILFERGSFAGESTLITSQCLAYYGIGILFYCYREILTRALAADKRQRVILKNTLLSVGFNIFFNLVFIQKLQHIGLALATSLAGIIGAILMFNDVKKIDRNLKVHIVWRDIVKIFIASCICLLLMFFINEYLGAFEKNLLLFIITSMVMVIVYVVVCYLLKVKTLIDSIEILRKMMFEKKRG